MADEDPAYLRWLRLQSCRVCGRQGPNTAHHHTARRPLGRRAHDHDAMTLCFVCHRDFHDARGHFRAMDRDERRQWQDDCVTAQRAIYEPAQGRFYDTTDTEPF